MKTCLGTRTDQKTLEGDTKWLEHESTFGLQEPIRHSKSAELPSCGLWPNGLRVMIMHTIFNLFTK